MSWPWSLTEMVVWGAIGCVVAVGVMGFVSLVQEVRDAESVLAAATDDLALTADRVGQLHTMSAQLCAVLLMGAERCWRTTGRFLES